MESFTIQSEEHRHFPLTVFNSLRRRGLEIDNPEMASHNKKVGTLNFRNGWTVNIELI
jgi:hypothetical protein